MPRATVATLAALLSLAPLDPAARAFAQAAAPFPVVTIESAPPRRHTWAYLSLAAGVGLIGLSFAFSQRADDAYAAYLASIDQDEIQRLYDRTVRYDHISRGSLLTGELLVATGLYLRFIRRPAAKRVTLSLRPARCALSYRF